MQNKKVRFKISISRFLVDDLEGFVDTIKRVETTFADLLDRYPTSWIGITPMITNRTSEVSENGIITRINYSDVLKKAPSPLPRYNLSFQIELKDVLIPAGEEISFFNYLETLISSLSDKRYIKATIEPSLYLNQDKDTPGRLKIIRRNYPSRFFMPQEEYEKVVKSKINSIDFCDYTDYSSEYKDEK
ncbi:hypothetical protein [Campylobacter sp. RM16192]|uniref:hypothetical protein n=1 Tax=Campylobacter sp. RM16192 TaxID=1660080 RepID=UPI00145138CB|nr:hypothetical protein [Campylobacter sp. RM16192]QCD52491.1 hypothetical protein CDOMC_0868 [Campylobacter sp. RM16192]